METSSINKVLQLFNTLSKSEQVEIAEKINGQTFKERWSSVDRTLPNYEICDDDIMKEVRAVRNGGK